MLFRSDRGLTLGRNIGTWYPATSSPGRAGVHCERVAQHPPGMQCMRAATPRVSRPGSRALPSSAAPLEAPSHQSPPAVGSSLVCAVAKGNLHERAARGKGEGCGEYLRPHGTRWQWKIALIFTHQLPDLTSHCRARAGRASLDATGSHLQIAPNMCAPGSTRVWLPPRPAPLHACPASQAGGP